MLARFKAFIASFKKDAKKEESESEYEVGVPPENEAVRADLQERRNKVAELLEPVDKNWEFIENTLLWKNALPACTCFFFISVVFWKFISMKLRRIVLIFGGFLLGNGLSSDMRAASWDFFERVFQLETQGDPVLQFNFDDLCVFIATSWAMLAHALKTVQDLSSESPPKFYCILAVSLFATLALFTYFPVLEFIYVTICVLFFYPSMHYYGIMDRINARVQRLKEPVVRHWGNNQTKRSRSIIRPKSAKEQDQLYDSDDEFILEKNQFTAKILSSVVPDDHESDEETYNEKSNDEILQPDFESDFFTESHFEEHLAMPSMSNFDSLMEPYDEFHSGLKFPDYTDSSRADTLHILSAAANNVDTDEEIDDLPYEPEEKRLPSEANEFHDGKSRIHQPSLEDDQHESHIQTSYDTNPFLYDGEIAKESELTKDDCTRAVEADFEFLEHSDLEADADLAINNQPVNDQQRVMMTSYTESGIATVSKWLGYE